MHAYVSALPVWQAGEKKQQQQNSKLLVVESFLLAFPSKYCIYL